MFNNKSRTIVEHFFAFFFEIFDFPIFSTLGKFNKIVWAEKRIGIAKIMTMIFQNLVSSDFLLMLLRELIPKRPDLKIILMSATLKAESFSAYFGSAPVIDIPGRTFPVEQIFLEEIIERTNYVLEENSRYARKIKGDWEKFEIELESADAEAFSNCQPKNTILDENLSLAQLIGRYDQFSGRTHKNLFLMDHEKINNELVEHVLEWIVNGDHEYPRDGSILVNLDFSHRSK